jgi:threonylcarbamoyladenosine tRNA methylthiotransferase CDKAL1
MQVYIKTYGCTLNQADSDLMSNILEQDGIEICASEQESDLVIVNTCTVKTPTQEKTFHTIKELEKMGKKVIVTGCMASANQDLVEKYAPDASIVTTSNIENITKAVKEASQGRKMVFNSYNKTDKLLFYNGNGGVIAKVPVSEGCLSNCSFCETKFARGPLNSFSEDRIVNAVAFSAKRGAKEVQITSQDIGAYGFDKKTNIAQLMKKLATLDGDFKIRIGMLNPEHLPKYIKELAIALQSNKFYKFVHLPIQSGSNIVLRDMKRRYTVEQFNDQVAYLREAVPGITIETDIIVGYPTETEEDFEMTLDFVRKIKPDIVNRCKFWPRPHASASKLVQLPTEIITHRGIELTRVVRQIQKETNDSFIGKDFDVLITEKEEGSMNGRLDSYKKVIIKSDAPILPLGSRTRVRIEGASSNVLYGKPVELISKIVV